MGLKLFVGDKEFSKDGTQAKIEGDSAPKAFAKFLIDLGRPTKSVQIWWTANRIKEVYSGREYRRAYPSTKEARERFRNMVAAFTVGEGWAWPSALEDAIAAAETGYAVQWEDEVQP